MPEWKQISIGLLLSIACSGCSSSLSHGFFVVNDEVYPLAISTPTPQSDVDPYREALADIWMDRDKYSIGDARIERKCNIYTCALSIKVKDKLVEKFSVPSGTKEWIKYGTIDLLGTKTLQLVIFTYSGGAHCCYDYAIYDLKPNLRLIYDSTNYNSANDIGDGLVPVNLNGEGVFEFYRNVIAFDYMEGGDTLQHHFPL